MEDLFSSVLPPTRESTGNSSVSLDSDSDNVLQSDEEDSLPSPMISPRLPIQQATIDSPTTPSEEISSSPPANPPIINPAEEPKITAGMPLSDVLLHLNHHGCKDVTQDLDKSKCNEYPERIGGFGEVYRGVLRNGTKVSIKILKMMSTNGDENKLFKHAAHELYIWSKCKHPNILELIGMAKFRNQITMVSPWMENGNLQSFLPQHSELDRCKMCVQISDSISYLHSQGVVHGDIKGANILVSHDHTPKLADFGNAWLSEEAPSLRFATTTSSTSMSIRWAAPEIVLENVQLSFKADIYSLGMTILEVITGLPPYESLGELAALSKIMTKTHPERPESHIPSGAEQADRLWSLLTDCWNPNPQDRPTANEVRNEMKAITPEGLLKRPCL
ncbi:tyrosine kinase catalytic domain protein [Rhizoctonia solani AG-3 Rhs1AP]|uniref:Tyrosine kinase catalytic domain protein n=1 Tax=Rhizoctonia solani AG-3 Rhs1AP TaxID=1086054 RepID=X8JFA7_9AGAM|nr:tyrosine kinase catalytic domain protein [Rhizoctonia solani AG-3 Rhs1AP]